MPDGKRALGLVLRNLAAPDVERLAGLAEQAGFTHVFFPENGHSSAGEIIGRDPFLLSSAALRGTKSLRAGPGVAASVIRPYYSAAITSATIHEGSGGRFIFGVGVSHAAAMHHRGEPYPSSPITHITEYLDKLAAMRPALSYGADFPVYLSALGPKMLQLAATRSAGVMLNWMNVVAATESAATFRANSATSAGATTVLYLRTGTPEALHAEAAQYARFPNYRAHFTRQGLDDMEAVVAATCLPSDPSALLAAVHAYRGAGIDIPTLYPVAMTPDQIADLIHSVAIAG